MCLGASNVSFGLPERLALNAGFLPMAMAAGLTSAIMSTAPVCVDAVRASRPAARTRRVGCQLDRRASRAPGDGGPGGARAVSGVSPQRRRLELAADGPASASDDGAARVRLRFLPEGAEVRVPSGTPVFDAASWNGIAIDSTCGGHGTCKKCRVRIVSGDVPVGPLDPRAFTADELRDGWRLACRAGARGRSGRRGAAVADPARRRRSPAWGATSSCARRSRSATWCWRSRRWRISAPISSACSTRSMIWSRTPRSRCCARWVRCCGPPGSTSPRSSPTRS